MCHFLKVDQLGDTIMADFISELATKCGISVDAARKGLGVVLGLLKSKLPAESFSKLSAAVPGVEAMLAAAADSGSEAAGGVVGTIKSAIGKVIGGGGTDALLTQFGQLGMSPDQMKDFLPNVMEFLKNKLPESVMKQISGLLPAPQEAAH
jgi:hypothetical protein